MEGNLDEKPSARLPFFRAVLGFREFTKPSPQTAYTSACERFWAKGGVSPAVPFQLAFAAAPALYAVSKASFMVQTARS